MKKMNRFATTALAVAGILACAAVARAQDVKSPTGASPGSNDLILAFWVPDQANATNPDSTTDTGGTQDLEVDLGSFANLTNGETFNINADLNAIYGSSGDADWNSALRSDELTWTVFGGNESTNEFWTTASNGSSPKEENSSTQNAAVSEMENVYGDLDTTGTTTHGSGQAAHSGNVSSSSDPNSFGQLQANDGGTWNYIDWGNGSNISNADSSTPINLYDVNPAGTAGTHAPSAGTFSLGSNGVLTFAAVPEPSTVAGIIAGAASLLAFRRRRRA